MMRSNDILSPEKMRPKTYGGGAALGKGRTAENRSIVGANDDFDALSFSWRRARARRNVPALDPFIKPAGKPKSE